MSSNTSPSSPCVSPHELEQLLGRSDQNAQQRMLAAYRFITNEPEFRHLTKSEQNLLAMKTAEMAAADYRVSAGLVGLALLLTQGK